MNKLQLLNIFWILVLILFRLEPAFAKPPRIGLVLSGGGAKGASHVGVLQVLEKLRIPIHAIAGTSMGALVGGAYASGIPLDKMKHIISKTDWDAMFVDDPPRSAWSIRRKLQARRPTWDFTIGYRDGKFKLPKGVISGQKVRLFLSDLVKHTEGIDHYDELPIPFRAVATNIENGKIKVFDRGPLAEALYASMSVPGFFAPLEKPKGLYVDGGLVRNLPVDIVRNMGVDIVIAANIEGSYLKREQLTNVIGVTAQMLLILIEQNVQRSLKELDLQKDVLITLNLGDIAATDFNRAADTITIGIKATRKVAKQLQRYQINPKAYLAWQNKRLLLNKPTTPVSIDTLRITGLNRVNPKVFNKLQQNNVHRTVDRTQLADDLQIVYGSGDFERIGYRIKRSGERNLLIIDAVEKTWGPGYLSFGLGLMNDYEGDNRFGLHTSYRRTWLNSLGAEWKTDLVMGNVPGLYTEFYQPLDITRTHFVVPYLDLSITPLHVYSGNNRIARYDVSSADIGADFGINFGKNAQIRFGPYWRTQRFSINTGSQVLPEIDLQDTGIIGQILIDTMDQDYVPRRGSRFTLKYRRPFRISKVNNQTPDMYNRVYTEWQRAYQLGQNSLIGTIRAGSSLGTKLAYYDQFTLGGFLNLTGYANEQFRGNTMVYGNLSYQYLLTRLPSPLGRGLYLGGSLEIGKIWGQDIFVSSVAGEPISTTPASMLYSASIFLGADTWLGPIYLGWGFSGMGQQGLYVLIGRLGEN